MKSIYILVLLTIVAIFGLVACGSGDDVAENLGELPTRAGDAQPSPEVTVAQVEEVTEVADESATDVNIVIPTITEITEQPATESVATEVVSMTETPEATSTPNPLDVDAIPTSPAPTLAGSDLLTPLEDVVIGDTVSIIGLLSIEGDTVFVETDDASYSIVQVNAPLAVVETLATSSVRVTGVVQSLPADDGEYLVMSVSSVMDLGTQSEVIPSLPGGAPQVNDFTLDEGTSPLAAVEVLLSERDALQLERIEGAIGSVWSIRIKEPDADTSETYNLQPSGSLVPLPALPAGPANIGAGADSFDPTDITVTLDDLVALIETELPDETPEALRIVLFNDGEQIAWLVSDIVATPLLKVDATTGDLLTPEAEPIPTPELPVPPGQGE